MVYINVIFLLLFASSHFTPGINGYPSFDSGKLVDKGKPEDNLVTPCGFHKCDSLSQVCATFTKSVGHHFVKQCLPAASPRGLVAALNMTEIGGLCGLEETPALNMKNSFRCDDGNDCGNTFQYDCVRHKDSPHSCKHKVCWPGEACVEQLHCPTDFPCVVVGECAVIWG